MSRRVLIFDDDLVAHPDFLGPTFAGLERRHGPIALRYRAHADEALAEIADFQPDLVLMDFQMGPHLDGGAATRLIRSRHDALALPVVGISSDSRFNRLILQAGANDACPKMALPQQLGALVGALWS